MAKIYPKIEIEVVQLGTMVLAQPSASGIEGEYECAINLPANTETTDKEYTLNVYSNDVKTAFSATVTVAGTSTTVDYYQVEAFAAYPEVLGSDGGEAVTVIKFSLA